MSSGASGAAVLSRRAYQPANGAAVTACNTAGCTRSTPIDPKPLMLDVIGYVEPKPGIPPTPSHTIDVIQEMKRQNVKVILVEPYFDLKTPNSVARETGAQVLVLAPSVGAEKEITDYFKLFDYNLDKLVAAFKATGAR